MNESNESSPKLPSEEYYSKNRSEGSSSGSSSGSPSLALTKFSPEKSPQEDSSSTATIDDLPDEILWSIFQLIESNKDEVAFLLTSKRFYYVSILSLKELTKTYYEMGQDKKDIEAFNTLLTPLQTYSMSPSRLFITIMLVLLGFGGYSGMMYGIAGGEIVKDQGLLALTGVGGVSSSVALALLEHLFSLYRLGKDFDRNPEKERIQERMTLFAEARRKRALKESHDIEKGEEVVEVKGSINAENDEEQPSDVEAGETRPLLPHRSSTPGRSNSRSLT